MNFFLLHLVAEICASMLIDEHIHKMPLEAAQLLYTAHWVLNDSKDWVEKAPLNLQGKHGYAMTHENSPWAKWIRKSLNNYMFLIEHAFAMCKEYTARCIGGVPNKVLHVERHLEWLRDNPPAKLTESCLTDMPCVVGTEVVEWKSNIDEVIDDYRTYYRNVKVRKSKFRWSKQEWLQPVKSL